MSPWSLCLCQAWEVMSGDDKRRLADTISIVSSCFWTSQETVNEHNPNNISLLFRIQEPMSLASLWIHRSFLILCCVLVNPKESMLSQEKKITVDFMFITVAIIILASHSRSQRFHHSDWPEDAKHMLLERWVFINDTILEKIETMTEIHFPNFSDIGFIIKSMPGRIISLSSSSVTRWIILCTSWTVIGYPPCPSFSQPNNSNFHEALLFGWVLFRLLSHETVVQRQQKRRS